jgi:hypothetical protein
MKLEIVHVPGCPHVALLEQRLDQVLADHPGLVERAYRVVDDLASAEAVGVTGSPTLLVDGVDPFAETGLAPGVSCRLYRDEGGQVHGAPTVEALRHGLGLNRSA